MVSSCSKSIGISWVDGLSIGPLGFGASKILEVFIDFLGSNQPLDLILVKI